VNFAIEKSEDPMPYFDRALDDAKKAAEINNKSHTPIFELARIYSNLSDYYKDTIKDLNVAEEYRQKSIDAYSKVDEIRNNYFSKINLAYNYYYLALLKIEQQKFQEAIDLMQKSIEMRFKVIPQRANYFDVYTDALEAQINLIQTLGKHNQEIKMALDNATIQLNNACDFENLKDKQKMKLDEYIQFYIDNNWLKRDNLEKCNL
ncbi:MAG: hypothetical protein AB8B80_10255, partial [Marinicellaceae bacterium]